MRFLVDESSGASVASVLRAHGHDVPSAIESMRGAPDTELLARAEAEDRILVTNDKDFGLLAYRLGRAHRGILLLRLKDERGENRAKIVAIVLESCGPKLEDRFTVATERGVRSRPMHTR